nr:hypothetical protein [Candidatus Sigynarchaeum springense]
MSDGLDGATSPTISGFGQKFDAPRVLFTIIIHTASDLIDNARAKIA